MPIDSNNISVNVITFGCRLNSCESEIIKGFAREIGVKNHTIINTCAVTAEAERKLSQTIRKIYKQNNLIQIILTGCAAELNPEKYIKMPGVVGIISNSIKLSKNAYLAYTDKDYLSSNNSDYLYQSNELDTLDRIRGFLQIQNGCDNKCTYCVVRITRGKNVSFSEDDIINQAKFLVQKGYKEIVLTGVNITSYGGDIGKSNGLPYIITHILKNVPEIRRMRLSSIDPADIDKELISVLTSESKIMPHIHESIQSGDNLILKRMLRKHTREDVINTNQMILSLRPDFIFGADFIVGFPTETEDMFENTKKIVHQASITLSHVFPFSPRPKTPAANMPEVNRADILKRSKDLRTVTQNAFCEKATDLIGKTIRVIAETEKAGKTDSFIDIVSTNNMNVGEEYMFSCELISDTQIVGKAVKQISDHTNSIL